jgi:hypothetical protein
MNSRLRAFLNRDLESYPTNARRIWYLELAALLLSFSTTKPTCCLQ